jgi:hypothetical protein
METMNTDDDEVQSAISEKSKAKQPKTNKFIKYRDIPKGAGPRRVKIGPIKWAKLN